MKKFVVFMNGDGYGKYMVEAAREAGASVPLFRTPFRKRVCEIHNTWLLNRVIELPLKRIWYKECFDENTVNICDEIYFIFFESFAMSYSRSYLKYLKKKFVNSKLIFWFSNPVGHKYNMERFSSVQKFYDSVVTFNEKDAVENQLLYCSDWMYRLPQVKPLPNTETDVFFVGSDKGRLELLIDIYIKLTELGLKCEFYVTDVPEEKQRYKNEIKYNHRLSYEEVLQHAMSSKCILEVLQDEQNYCSIRTIEAIQLKKKLLTTNKHIYKQRYYRPEIIQVIQEVANIDMDFFNYLVDEDVYDNLDIGDFKYVADFLVKNI